tara:strand:- start:111 stop:668 length:558 start_codon:yes stop_codon:yes gene_type:complete
MSANKSFSTETSERYSRALFDVAKEAGELDKVEIDIKNFQSLLKSSNDLENFIHNPTQSVLVQLKVINILSEKLNFSKNLSNFFSLLTEKRRIFFLLKIIESFLKLCSKKRGEIKASLISSKELNDSEIENISNDLSNSIGLKIKIDYKIDKDLIGGLKFQIGSLMVDTSIKNKLKKLEQNMIEN